MVGEKLPQRKITSIKMTLIKCRSVNTDVYWLFLSMVTNVALTNAAQVEEQLGARIHFARIANG